MSVVQARGNWLFPMVLAIGLGAISFWLDRITEVKTVEIPLNPKEPKYQFLPNGLINKGSLVKRLTLQLHASFRSNLLFILINQICIYIRMELIFIISRLIRHGILPIAEKLI